MIALFMTRFFQRSPFFRFLVLPALFVIFAVILAGIGIIARNRPVLESLSPAIAEPGEVVVIQGRHFGNEKGDGWIEIAGNRISGTSYLKWTNTTIMALIPEAVDDGLVYVVNRAGKSNPLIFANRMNIPVAARMNTDLGLPQITSFDTGSAETGKRIVISGRNFGITRSKSSVLFSWQIDSAIPVAAVSRTNQLSIACSEHDFDYEFWSDQEIRVRVPDGATSGNVFVQTERGMSNPMNIQITNQPGTKKYVDRHTFVLSLEVDITGVSASEGNMLFIRVPVPEVTATQRGVEVTASSPKPYMDNYRGTILHQLENIKSGRNEKISHSFLLTNYALEITVNPALVKPYSDTDSPLYLMYTATDRIVPADSPAIALAAAGITGKEKNPYLKAKLIYEWLAANIEPFERKNPDRTVLEALSSKTGDAYDTAILFSALARASGIPSIPVAGVLVDKDQTTRPHWWAEFYIENFGWVPVDPGLAAMESGKAAFGDLDVYHIAFSRGWTDAKPVTAKSRVVYKPRSFAFQPIWEESGGNIKSYTSFWAEPKVTGVY